MLRASLAFIKCPPSASRLWRFAGGNNDEPPNTPRRGAAPDPVRACGPPRRVPSRGGYAPPPSRSRLAAPLPQVAFRGKRQPAATGNRWNAPKKAPKRAQEGRQGRDAPSPLPAALLGVRRALAGFPWRFFQGHHRHRLRLRLFGLGFVLVSFGRLFRPLVRRASLGSRHL